MAGDPGLQRRRARLLRGNGTPYVDITQLCEEHTDLYQDDGVHLLGGFYPLWGTELIAEVYDYVFALESNESAAE